MKKCDKIGNKNKTYFEFSKSIFSECLVDPPSLPYCSSSNPCSAKKGKKVFFLEFLQEIIFYVLSKTGEKKFYLLVYDCFLLFLYSHLA